MNKLKKSVFILILIILVINISSCSKNNDVNYPIRSARIYVGSSEFDTLSVKKYKFLDNGTIMITDKDDRIFIVDKSNVLLLNLSGSD